jgi:hypothetical protein
MLTPTPSMSRLSVLLAMTDAKPTVLLGTQELLFTEIGLKIKLAFERKLIRT